MKKVSGLYLSLQWLDLQQDAYQKPPTTAAKVPGRVSSALLKQAQTNLFSTGYLIALQHHGVKITLVSLGTDSAV